MSDVVAADGGSKILRQLSLVEQAGTYATKGYSYRDISEILGVTHFEAKNLVNEYYKIVAEQAAENPYFLEQIQFNTIKALKELDEISKEAWETVNLATDNEMITARTQALKLALEVSTKKAQLHNLLNGGAKDQAGGGDMARVQKIESVNQILSSVLKDVISECSRCKDLARVKLAEAFSLMDDDNVVDGEVVQ